MCEVLGCGQCDGLAVAGGIGRFLNMMLNPYCIKG